MIRNKKYIAFLLSLLISASTATAQTFGNEWIDFNQEYFKIAITKDGMYRLTFDQLNNAGFPVNTVDPRRIQLFNLGVEQSINIEGQLDGNFDSSDYIEFYGQGNDGTTDTQLYVTPEAQPHTYYNLFSDTSAYFLTYKLSAETGKRMTSFFENNVTSIPAESNFEKEVIQLFTTSYHEGESYGASNETVLSQYDVSEGWTGSFASLGQSLDHTLQGITNTFVSTAKPQLEVLLASGNNNSHNAEIFVGRSTGSLRSIGTAEFDKDETFLFSAEIEWSDISSTGELAVRATINGVNGQADRMAFSYIRLVYPRTFNLSEFDNQKLKLESNPAGKSFIQVDNPVSNSSLWDITDLSNVLQVGVNTSFQELTAVVPNTDESRILYLQSQVLAPPSIKPVSFEQINPTDFNYLMVTNSVLRSATSDSNPDPVQAYKDYRESIAGGGYNVYLAEIDHLFDQFNYGLTSPLAVRRFCHYMLTGGQPEHLFIIGRGTDNNFDYYRQDPATAEATNFVPTYGHPGSDIAFTAGLSGPGLEESIPTGRINAKNSDEVQAYLNKVIETESLVYDELWHKNIIHLTGGQNESELVRFRQFGEQFEDIAEGPFLGGSVSKTSKKTNDAVEFFNITKEINEGVGLITFFGHSGASITDIEVGIVSDPSFGYNNTGRYPTFIVNGCNAGAFFGVNESFGIDWVLTPNLGALSFMAHSSLAFSNNLRNYTNIFYTVAFADEEFFAKTLGEIKQEVSRRYGFTYGSGAFSASQVQQFVLQGDPAIKVFAADKPDFDIVEESLIVDTYDGSPILSEVDSFYIDIDVKNYGKFSNEPFLVKVTRTLPNGAQVIYGPETFDPILRQDTLRFKINNEIEGVAGNNTLEIVLDSDDIIEEMVENNNSTSINLFLATGSTFNTLPQNNSIQTNSNIDFIFQSTDLLAGTRSFLLEIDTLPTFNSPYLSQQSVSANVVSKVTIDLESGGSFPLGTEVFWRTKFENPLSSEIDDWVTSSFILQSSGSGWNQSDNAQLNQSARTGLAFDEVTGVWGFLSNDISLEINTFGPNHPTSTNVDTEFRLDGTNFYETNSPFDPGCRNNTLNIVAFDFQSTVPYKPIEFGSADVLNNLVCGKIPQVIYNIAESEFGGGVNPESIIDNIKERDQVLVFSLGQLNYSTWSVSLKSKLTELGINQSTLDNLEDGEPIIFFGRKGDAQGTATEILTSISPKSEQSVELNSVVSGSFFSGQLISEKIGPALAYSEFTFDLDQTDGNVDDIFDFTLFGIDENNNETALITNIQTPNTDISSIDASIYPFVRIQMNLEDQTDLTPHQLRQWTVEYEPAPEGILLKRDPQGIDEPISRQEGEPLTTSFTYWNPSKKNYSDSVKINYSVFNRTLNTSFLDSLKLKPLVANDSVNFDVNIETLGKSGMNDLIINSNEADQLEVHENNNNIRLTEFLQIVPDDSNPILEVSFDGVFILDGDIVSPNPNILIKMKDENQFLFKQDTLDLDLFIRRPCEGCDYERVAFSSPEVTWQAADENSDFRIDYVPTNLENGIYGLRVQVSDASGNSSGNEPYEINFEVVNESTITSFYPYPNPFSSSTKFVFTLTGNDIPDDIKIQIMTVTGRVVREILRDELGAIRIGNNITDYAWDGRDEYGDQLANGVYLYKVYLKQNGQDVAHRETAGDKGFKNGFGKLYLLR